MPSFEAFTPRTDPLAPPALELDVPELTMPPGYATRGADDQSAQPAAQGSGQATEDEEPLQVISRSSRVPLYSPDGIVLPPHTIIEAALNEQGEIQYTTMVLPPGLRFENADGEPEVAQEPIHILAEPSGPWSASLMDSSGFLFVPPRVVAEGTTGANVALEGAHPYFMRDADSPQIPLDDDLVPLNAAALSSEDESALHILREVHEGFPHVLNPFELSPKPFGDLPDILDFSA